jgi:hypothetical protein
MLKNICPRSWMFTVGTRGSILFNGYVLRFLERGVVMADEKEDILKALRENLGDSFNSYEAYHDQHMAELRDWVLKFPEASLSLARELIRMQDQSPFVVSLWILTMTPEKLNVILSMAADAMVDRAMSALKLREEIDG